MKNDLLPINVTGQKVCGNLLYEKGLRGEAPYENPLPRPPKAVGERVFSRLLTHYQKIDKKFNFRLDYLSLF